MIEVLRRPIESTLAALIAVMDHAVGPALLQRHVQRREHEIDGHLFAASV
ncbi:hypothetical protein [Variovorax sp. J22R115]|nr:hypothetical protein [Variovorax sp. J22R115]MDM0053801.1 hypothetical protein [Variovorax sp. J22R115]